MDPNQIDLQQALAARTEIKKLITQILTAGAIKRLENIRATKPQFALQVELYLTELYRAGQLKTPVDEQRLKALLENLVEKRSPQIVRK